MRDSAWVRREYQEEKWPAVARLVDGAAARPGADLARVVAEVQAAQRPAPSGMRRETIVDGRLVSLPTAVAWDGKYALISDLLRDACSADTCAVIELGSGWGVNLFRLWLKGGPSAVRHVGAEYTEAGRRCAERLAALAPVMDFRSLPFDYTAPDFAPFTLQAGHAVVFTCQSIEQVPRLDPAVVAGMAAVAPRVTGLHFEPVGWQVPPPIRPPGHRGSSAAYAERNDYNRNLWAVLTAAERRRVLAIEAVDADLFGTNPENALTVIRWTAVR